MTSTMRRQAVAILALSCMLLFPLQAQEEERPRERPGDGGPFRERTANEVVTFEPQTFAADSGLVRVDVLYRIRYDFFVFTHDYSAGPQSYRAHGNILIELIDSTETSVSRNVSSISLHASNNELLQLRQQYYQGTASLLVKPGRLTAVYRVEDEETRREFGDRKQMLNIPGFKENSSLRSTLTFVEPPADPPASSGFVPLNNGNTAHFALNTGVVVSVSDEDISPTVRYSLVQVNAEGRERSLVQKETTIVANIFRRTNLRLDAGNPEGLHYILDSNARTTTLYFTLPTSHLKQGRYTARFHFGSRDTSSVSKDFSIRWIDMPLSLWDLDFAVSAMKYIATDDEFDDLRSGGRTNRIKKFEEFWTKRDKTPGTAYNEVLAEYFRRVDYAFTAFKTLKEENGAMTDRGRIHILFGKPSNIVRSLAPGGPPTEVWTYSALNKEFIFEDPSKQGNYKLIASESK